MTHCHHHDHEAHHDGVEQRLSWSMWLNIALTLAQIVGGVLSGSLALIAEAVHNFSDALTLLMAVVARKIGRRKPDLKRTYGYKKVETLAAYTNFISLILISIWLAFEAVGRLISPEQVGGWTVIIIAVIAFVVNTTTVLLLRRDQENSQNVRAAFLHNLADTLSSLGVVVAGVLIVLLDWQWVDPVITLLISAYIVWHAFHDLPDVVNILIDGAPRSVALHDVVKAIRAVHGVDDVHHVHVRYLSEHSYAMEAHIVLRDGASEAEVKHLIEAQMAQFHIAHTTLECEREACGHAECT
ncbi:MAG: cation diffusion facilitator family transporter [Pseudobdellovibrionaceae bacterium]